MTSGHIPFDLEIGDRYLAVLRGATAEQWERFARALDPLRGDDIGAVWRRARAQLVHPDHVRRTVPLVYLAATTTIAALELVRELWGPPDPVRARAAMRHATADMEPEHRRVHEQRVDLLEIGARALPGDVLAHDVPDVRRHASLEPTRPAERGAALELRRAGDRGPARSARTQPVALRSRS
ncbi:MAG TPA: hypothetical protein VEA99_16275, partial [Gemmatimonadaceae bacterium]|nr:hypothetical protein [Gemmatimonadaceae bacterium]